MENNNDQNQRLPFLEEFFSGKKKITRNNWYIVLLAGVLLFIILLPTKNNTSYLMKQEKTEKIENTQTLQETMQNELEAFLSGIEGVGRVKVLIYLQKNEEIGYAKEQQAQTITGVIIGAEGARNEMIRLQIIKMVMALYDLEADEVEVYPLTETSKE